METKLERIAEVAKTKPKERFTSLTHLINKETLKQCHQEMNDKRATGADEVTREMYSENLEENIEELITRIKRQAYKPQPARRVYIPKAGTILNNDSFPCDKCGNCCRNLKNNPLYSFLDRGDGICNSLDEKTNLCKIYDNRPNICRVDEFFKSADFMLTKQEYYKLNKSLCENFKEGK